MNLKETISYIHRKYNIKEHQPDNFTTLTQDELQMIITFAFERFAIICKLIKRKGSFISIKFYLIIYY